jgi:hypothetical protein
MVVVTAFLNPPVEGDVYMELPEELLEYLTISATIGHKQGMVKQGSICKLKKALYGLKEAPQLWHAHIDRFLHSLGFTRPASDTNLYILELIETEGGYLFLLLYLDDLLIACQCRIQVNRVKKATVREVPNDRSWASMPVSQHRNP